MAKNPYETDRLLSEYLLFHYGRPEEVLPYSYGPTDGLDFPARAVIECLDSETLPPHARGLDLGCAVGRTSFELAHYCQEVVAIDFSENFIRVANVLRDTGSFPYVRIDEGRIATPLEAFVPSGIDPKRVNFQHGDACNLPGDLGQFDVALLINLIDRLPDPLKCLRSLPGLLKSGAQLVVASPFTWLKEYTPPAKWLGGYEKAGQPVSTFETLKAVLEPDFEFVRSADLPFLIREHARKFQWNVSLAGVWRRR